MKFFFDFKKKILRSGGFTLVESLVSLSILLLIFVMAVPGFRVYQDKADVQSQVDEIVGQLSLAREKTISSEMDSVWGIRISASTTPQTIVLFKGSNFDTRDTSFDIETNINPIVNIQAVDFEGRDWMVFRRVSGQASSTGYISVRSEVDNSRTAELYLNYEGLVSLEPFNATTTDRITDSRHVHIIYTRSINTATEDIILSFDGGTEVETIPINDNLIDGQFVWVGEVEVGGFLQELEVRTHSINNPNTIFSIHREVDKNNVSLDMDISGDTWPSPQIIYYSADGKTVTVGNSPSVSLIEEQ